MFARDLDDDLLTLGHAYGPAATDVNQLAVSFAGTATVVPRYHMNSLLASKALVL